MKIQQTQGFTLIELLVVILIIGILAAVALPQYQKAVDKAHFTELIPLVRAVTTAQELYYAENGTYAPNCRELGLDLPANATWNSSDDIDIGNDNSGKEYIRLNCFHGSNRVAGVRVLPVDPGSPYSYSLYSYESFLAHTDAERAGQTICWSSGRPRYDDLCQRVCKEELDSDGQCMISQE